MRRFIPVALLAVLVAAALAPVAQAEERTCRGTIGAITVDNLRVPQGAACTLNGTRVQGTIKVERGATLVANGVRVIGNTQSEGAASVTVRSGSRVNGSIQVVQGGRANVIDSFVGGTILFDSNRGSVNARRNRIGGNLQAFQNTGGVSIFNNVIDENLQCKANVPRPTGGGNIVGGNKEDQCRAF